MNHIILKKIQIPYFFKARNQNFNKLQIKKNKLKRTCKFHKKKFK